MYYIRSKMNNTIFKLLEYLYYFSLFFLFALYLFPGSLIGYFLYRDLGQQPDLISNPIGTSINHLIYFFYLTILSQIVRSRLKKFFTNIYFVFFISIILEISHLVVPNRAFEYYDLLANVLGVILVIIMKKLIK
jgi:hypothetical protein